MNAWLRGIIRINYIFSQRFSFIRQNRGLYPEDFIIYLLSYKINGFTLGYNIKLTTMERIYSIINEYGAVRLEAFSAYDPNRVIDEIIARTIEEAEYFTLLCHASDYVYAHIV